MSRDFRKIVTGNVTSQKQKQRFPYANGAPSSPGMSLNDLLDSDDDEPQVADPTGPHQPPRIAEWRSNLVALSQRENLYFAAYQDKIHVTIPLGLRQTIHGKPDLILDLPQSKDATRVGGYIDRTNGHCANHIIVGNLGALEIVLVACDDGDAIAFYTHNIQAAIKSPGNQHNIRPCFHDNVGISAWGLAIHAKSRMIAVSSNNREVVVFRYGCTTTSTSTSSGTTTYEDYDEGLLDVFSEQIQLTESKAALFPAIAQPDSTIRWNSFRRVLKLGPEGHNIPSIDFSSDSKGDAHSILATDILGNLWVLDIWGDEAEHDRRRIPSIHKDPPRGNTVMGWGALVLPLRAFKRTATPEEALGVPALTLEKVVCKAQLGQLETRLERHFDITDTLSKVDDSSPYHPLFGYGLGGPGTAPTLPTPNTTAGLGTLTSSERSSNQDVKLKFFPPQAFAETGRKYFEALINTPENEVDVESEAKFAKLMRLAEFDNPLRESTESTLKRLESKPDPEPAKGDTKSPVYRLQDKCAILRTYQDDIELLPPTQTIPRTICRKVLKQTLPVPIAHQIHFERLIFQALIVELSLVIVGSQIGRVALISLTRPEDSFSHNGPVTMFRIDQILPTKTHETQGFRPSVPLLGLAVSPLQGQQMKERRRWRLIMHYYDHSILSYELSREGDDLLVL